MSEVEHEPAMCPCHNQGQWYPGLHQTKRCQQVKEGDPSHLFSIAETKHGLLCPVLGSITRHGRTGESPTKGHRITESQNVRGWKGLLWVI